MRSHKNNLSLSLFVQPESFTLTTTFSHSSITFISHKAKITRPHNRLRSGAQIFLLSSVISLSSHLYKKTLILFLLITSKLKVNLVQKVAPRTDHILFEVNYDGFFLEGPLRYEYGLNLEWKLCRSKRMSYSEMCDMLVDRLEDNIWVFFYCVPECSLGEGFTIVESNGDMNKIYQMTDLYGLIELYVAHTPQKLALWYYKNLPLDGSDEAATLKSKIHEIRLKDAISMSFKELVAWEKEEARSLTLDHLLSLKKILN